LGPWSGPEAGVSVFAIDRHDRLGVRRHGGALIGREAECRSLDELLVDVHEGRSRSLVVRGEAGVGKTALLHHLLDAADGWRVLIATGVESEMELPFAALHQLCAPMLDRLDALPEPQRDAARTAFGLAAGATPDRFLIGLAILSLFSTVAEDGPLLCVVDDAQWLDSASEQVLAFVARRLLADRVGLVFATRHLSAATSALPELALAPLTDADARELLGTVLHGTLDERVRDRIVAETRGNPLALVEWPRGRTPAELAGGFGMPTRLPMISQNEENFRRRIGVLPPTTQRLLTLIAAEPTGDPVILWRAADAIGIEPHQAVPAIDAGLLDVGVRMSFRHPLVRSAAYNAASLEERQAAHREIAAATDPETDADRRAWHRALGCPGPDDEIADALAQSASRARARGGLAAAGALLERSAALTLDPASRALRMLDSAETLLAAGAIEATDAMLAAIDVDELDDGSRARVDFVRGFHMFVTGSRRRETPTMFLQAGQRLERLGAGLAHHAYLHAMGAAMNVGCLSGHLVADEIAHRALDSCTDSASTWMELLCAGLSESLVAGPVAARTRLRQALDACRREAVSAEAYRLYGYTCGAALELWDIESYLELASDNVRVTRQLGALTQLPAALNTLAYAVALVGDIERAAGLVAEVKQISEMIEGYPVHWGVASVAGLRASEDDGATLASLIDHAGVEGMEMVVARAQWATITFHNAHGEYQKGLAFGEAALGQRYLWGNDICLHELVEAAARSGELVFAARVLARLEGVVDADSGDWALGVLSRSRALLADDGAAEPLYRDAVERLARTALRPECARAHLLYGEWLRRQNRRVDAREQLRAAHAEFAAMKMHGFAERTRRELLATGETVRKRDVDSLDELTAQEALIARLAVEGRTNAEIGAQLFISPRTVEWHLRKVFTKLDVGSRRSLRDALPASQTR
jgi:DNA-binding CsgD family transcriptional regulator